ncbi:MAG: fructosamine kinase family protein [Planctomycetota bacterium]|jgi:fructosamine-3-kinase
MIREELLTKALGRAPQNVLPLSGGCVGEVYLVTSADSARLVAKVDDSATGRLDIEGYMLDYLAPHLPVPNVVHAAPNLLLMEWLPGSQIFDQQAQEHAAVLLAGLHDVTRKQCGLERDTLIGGLHQPNPATDSWIAFFAEHRLLHMAREAHGHGHLDTHTLGRVEKVAGRLDEWIEEPAQFSLLHGDIWSGNVLAKDGRITGFLDPAVYFGHPEVELAFISMFHTFTTAFFEAYSAVRPIDQGFAAQRCHLYNLYPYLVHTRLFGGSYGQSVKTILKLFGC